MNEKQGHLHPLTNMIGMVANVFLNMGFVIAEGPYIEDQWHNFDALNIPKNHPARDMQDTFFIKHGEGRVLRTHTSSVQVRFMEEFIQAGHTPPFKIISPGVVFRNEATDATHEVQFNQVEGLVVGEKISLGHLKGVLEEFLKELFGDTVEFRIRPGYFPFVEPGIEIDLKFKGKWLEVLGAGMVHPHVLENVGINPEHYSGFAFGIGLDRLAMMMYDIPDVRMFYHGDLRLHNALKPF